MINVLSSLNSKLDIRVIVIDNREGVIHIWRGIRYIIIGKAIQLGGSSQDVVGSKILKIFVIIFRTIDFFYSLLFGGVY